LHIFNKQVFQFFTKDFGIFEYVQLKLIILYFVVFIVEYVLVCLLKSHKYLSKGKWKNLVGLQGLTVITKQHVNTLFVPRCPSYIKRRMWVLYSLRIHAFERWLNLIDFIASYSSFRSSFHSLSSYFFLITFPMFSYAEIFPIIHTSYFKSIKCVLLYKYVEKCSIGDFVPYRWKDNSNKVMITLIFITFW